MDFLEKSCSSINLASDLDITRALIRLVSMKTRNQFLCVFINAISNDKIISICPKLHLQFSARGNAILGLEKLNLNQSLKIMFLFLHRVVCAKKRKRLPWTNIWFREKCLTSNLIENNLTPMFAQLNLCKFRGENKLFMWLSANDWQF